MAAYQERDYQGVTYNTIKAPDDENCTGCAFDEEVFHDPFGSGCFAMGSLCAVAPVVWVKKED